ncbi:MAG: hypothetical protein EOP48_12015 [Sphingobacteriales bacterium]|nr:MAG: hypothetical protein EOP48_12015 [Sphingobacteriales bacterium]
MKPLVKKIYSILKERSEQNAFLKIFGRYSAGMTEVLGTDRKYYLFDSFEGLPEVQEIDGEEAKNWQSNANEPDYFDNCSADISYARSAMQKTNTTFEIKKGWFSDTLPGFVTDSPIACLRLDGDWYESTMDCFKFLYPQVVNGGLILIDDYFTWEGCSKAVHDYLSLIKSSSCVHSQNGVAYIIKKDE